MRCARAVVLDRVFRQMIGLVHNVLFMQQGFRAPLPRSAAPTGLAAAVADRRTPALGHGYRRCARAHARRAPQCPARTARRRAAGPRRPSTTTRTRTRRRRPSACRSAASFLRRSSAARHGPSLPTPRDHGHQPALHRLPCPMPLSLPSLVSSCTPNPPSCMILFRLCRVRTSTRGRRPTAAGSGTVARARGLRADILRAPLPAAAGLVVAFLVKRWDGIVQSTKLNTGVVGLGPLAAFGNARETAAYKSAHGATSEARAAQSSMRAC